MSDIQGRSEKSKFQSILTELSEKLSGSELNSFLLELFRKRAKRISLAELFHQFEKNRFTAPSTVETIEFKELVLSCLRLAKQRDFELVTLSPLTALATCSAFGFVDQNNVVSALRGTEVLSDATNVFALLIAGKLKKDRTISMIKLATTHRHVRSQLPLNPMFTAHFGVFCMATGGRDLGNFAFEIGNLIDHMELHSLALLKHFPADKLFVRIFLKNDNSAFREKLKDALAASNIRIQTDLGTELNPGNYYQFVQFRFFLKHKGSDINLSDGGFVDWTQKLLQNRKQRLLISGVGIELISKIDSDQN